MDADFLAQTIKIAHALVTSPQFDSLHDPNKRTALIEPYHDPSGYPTIGYGHLLSKVAWEPLEKYPAITVDQAKALLMVDLGIAAKGVQSQITTQLNVFQFAALIDFVFNAGVGNLRISALRKVVNRRDFGSVPKQLERWVYSRGVKLPGLVRRRRAEAELFARAA
ncbi:lysozyme [Pseudomonas shirazensis]|uniref:lysozyme n=1 Tax=Pseudomonas shirazensis TaxID=2745494 RepID=UPI003D2D1335